MFALLKKCAHRTYGRIIRWGQEFYVLPEYLIKVIVSAGCKVNTNMDVKTARKAIQTYTAAQREQALREMKVRSYLNIIRTHFAIIMLMI